MGRFIENGQIVAGFVPVNMATAANNGDVVSLAKYGHLTVIFFKGAGASGEDPTLTLLQCAGIAGTPKALNFTELWVKQGADLAAIGEFTKVTQAAGNTYTEATSGEAQAIWVLEIDASDLDIAHGYNCVQVTVADVGSSSQIGSLLYLLSEPRYAQANTPSAIA